MIKLISKMRGFSQDQSGATAIEYGLIAAAIAVVLIAGMALLGGGLTTMFTTVSNALGG
jgi:pilus assembly protein Flp/PilA